MIKKIRIAILLIAALIAMGFLLPEPKTIPVEGASSKDWNPETFWFYPWGSSVVHKGIDIFGRKGTPVIAPTNLWVLYAGEISKGGNVVLALGPKWRLHYFAHLDTVSVKAGQGLGSGEAIARLGDTGNALGKPPHLHYSIVTLIPYLWRVDDAIQGYKKMFYLDPGAYLLRD